MRCPSCDHALEEISAVCPGCGFSLGMADQQFGKLPPITSRVTDPHQLISRGGRAEIIQSIADFESRFPGVRITILTHKAPSHTPVRPYLFWLFNRCELHTALERAGNNRHILLWLDRATKQPAVMIGYGLEPLIPEALLQESLAAAGTPANAGRFDEAVLQFIRTLDQGLAVLHARLPKIFGWFPAEAWSPLEEEDETAYERGSIVY